MGQMMALLMCFQDIGSLFEVTDMSAKHGEAESNRNKDDVTVDISTPTTAII